MEKFDYTFQKHFVAYLLRDTTVLRRVRKFLKPEHFENEILSNIVRIVIRYFDKYGEAPDDLTPQYLRECRTEGALSENIHDILQGTCTELLEENLHNRAYLLSRYDAALRQIAFSATITKYVDTAKAGKLDEAQELMRRALRNCPSGVGDLGSWYNPDPTERILRRAESEKDKIYTLIPKLDERGILLSKTELGIIQGQLTGIGKSYALCQLARNAVIQGKKAVIFSLELGEGVYEDRLDMCISGLCLQKLDDFSTLSTKIRRIIKNDRAILIKKFPAQYTTIDDLDEHLKRLEEEEGWVPDLMLLDYADLLGSQKNYSDIYSRGFEVFSSLYGLLEKRKLACWNASQSGREAGSKGSADMNQTAGSRAKNEIADIVLTINRTSDEEMKGLTRIRAEKVRSNKSRYEIVIPTDLSRAQFWDSGRERNSVNS